MPSLHQDRVFIYEKTLVFSVPDFSFWHCSRKAVWKVQKVDRGWRSLMGSGLDVGFVQSGLTEPRSVTESAFTRFRGIAAQDR